MPPTSALENPGSDVRDARVDWLRGAAALMVLFHHAFAIPDPSPIPGLMPFREISRWGYLGVSVFFVLSGRCVGRTWLRGNSAAKFALKRVRRIYPPYLASLVVCAAVIALRKFTFGINDLAPVPTSFGAIVATLTLATSPVTSVPVMNWVYWSLSYELVFYALLAVLLFVRPLQLQIRAWLILHAALCVLDALKLGHDQAPLFFIQYWNLFALGVGLCLRFAGRPQGTWSLGISGCHAIVLGLQARLGLPHLFGALTALALVAPTEWWQPRASGGMVRLGLISYSLYLIHLPVGIYLVQANLRPMFAGSLVGSLVIVSAVVIASIGTAWIFYREIERRFSSAPPHPA